MYSLKKTWDQMALVDAKTPDVDIDAIISRVGHSVMIYERASHCWWRPLGSGHTAEVHEAGVYTTGDAVSMSGHCGPEKGIVYVRAHHVLRETIAEHNAILSKLANMRRESEEQVLGPKTPVFGPELPELIASTRDTKRMLPNRWITADDRP